MGLQIEIRKAAETDVAWISAEMQKFSEFFGSKISLYPSKELADVRILDLINNHVFLIAERGGELMGFVAGYFVIHPFNPGIKMLSETFWWVQEEHRRSRAGLLLLNEFVRIGKEIADWVTISLEHKSEVNERALLKRGFDYYEKSFIMEVTRCQQ